MSTTTVVLIGGLLDQAQIADLPEEELVQPGAELSVSVPVEPSEPPSRQAVYELLLDDGLPSRDDQGRLRFAFRETR